MKEQAHEKVDKAKAASAIACNKIRWCWNRGAEPKWKSADIAHERVSRKNKCYWELATTSIVASEAIQVDCRWRLQPAHGFTCCVNIATDGHGVQCPAMALPAFEWCDRGNNFWVMSINDAAGWKVMLTWIKGGLCRPPDIARQ